MINSYSPETSVDERRNLRSKKCLRDLPEYAYTNRTDRSHRVTRRTTCPKKGERILALRQAERVTSSSFMRRACAVNSGEMCTTATTTQSLLSCHTDQTGTTATNSSVVSVKLLSLRDKNHIPLHKPLQYNHRSDTTD